MPSIHRRVRGGAGPRCSGKDAGGLSATTIGRLKKRMRRGKIAALRRRSLDLDAGQLAVVASTEQTKAGCREKDAKSGRCRTIALPALVVTELRRHRIEQAQAVAVDRRPRDRGSSRRHAGRRHAAAAEQHHPRRYAVHEEARQQGEATRAAPLARDTHACRWCSSEDRQRAPRAQQGGDDSDLYSHVLPGMQEDAASQVDAMMSAALEERAKGKR